MPDYLNDLIKKAKEAKKQQAAEVSKEPQSKPVMQEVKREAQPSRPVQIPTAQPAKIPASVEETAVPEKSALELELEAAKKVEIAAYGETKIFKVAGQQMLYYYVPVPRPTAADKTIINTIKEAATRLITIAPYRIRDPSERRSVYYQRIMEILRNSPELKIPPHRFDFYANAVVREMVGYGLIDSLVSDDKLEEIMIIGPKMPVYVFHREYEMMLTNIEFFNDNEIQDLINRIARQIGRRIDISAPLLDARLPDGSRVNATIPPASVEGSTLTIRKFKKDPYSLIDLINFNTISLEAAAFLWLIVEGLSTTPANILISGGTGSGKTTLLNVLSSLVPPSERIVSIEDTAELNLPLKHWIRLEARPPGLEGKGELTLDILTKNSLRMRPDRIIVGEIRHDEAFTLFTAMNTGHDGCLTFENKIALTTGLQEIGNFVDSEISKSVQVLNEGNWEVCNAKGSFINCLNSKGNVEKQEIVQVRRKPFEGSVKHVKFASGNEITVTPNHPFFKLSKGIVVQESAERIQEGEFFATPSTLLREQDSFDPELSYFSGLMHGDGNVLEKTRIREKNGKNYNCLEGRLSLFTEEPAIIPKFQEFLSKRVEGCNSTVLPACESKNCFEVRVNSYHNSMALKQMLSMPSGSRLGITPNNKIYTASIADFVAGFFDAEGHVDLNNNALVFASANENYIDFVKHALLCFGIQSRKYESRSGSDRWFRLFVYGIENVRKFSESFKIKYSKKVEKLEELLSKGISANTNVDVIPCNDLIAEKLAAAKAKGVSVRAIAKTAGISQGLLQFLKNNKRKPSKKIVEKLAFAFEKVGISASDLKQLASAQVFWDKVVAVHDIPYNGFVYDLTVSEEKHSGKMPHNFVAEGIIVGNSMGTVHANSAQETIIRVTNPPMNVPEVMLSGLDFIIIENRLHDRKKGTIRRVIEISEVAGVLERKAQTQTIFERDPVEDSLKRTQIPSQFVGKLCKMTGLSKKQIDSMLEERQAFLKKLADNNLRSISEVSAAVQHYINEKRTE